MSLLGYFLKALALTVLIEWAFSWLFLRRRRNRVVVILAQCVTNPIANLIVFLKPFGLNFWQIICPVEIVVVLAEWAIYARCFSTKSKLKPFLFSFLANTISFSLGLFLSNML